MEKRCNYANSSPTEVEEKVKKELLKEVKESILTNVYPQDYEGYDHW